MPLYPLLGHVFHLDLGTVEMPVRDSCICVELERNCTSEQLLENTLCFLHHLKDALSKYLYQSPTK